jgi:hypothetical protein
MSFPSSFIGPIITALQSGVPNVDVVARRLGANEGNDTIGVFPATWRPMEDSMEIGKFGTQRLGVEPTLNFYSVKIQNLRIDADEIAGRAAHDVTSKLIRAILYRDNTLHVTLQSLTESTLGVTERPKKMDIVKQDYLDTLTTMGMYFLTTTELVFTTESTPTV